MTREEFWETIYPLSSLEQAIHNDSDKQKLYSEQVLSTAPQDDRGYYHFTDQYLASSESQYQIHFSLLKIKKSGIRITFHTRFTSVPPHFADSVSIQYVVSGSFPIKISSDEYILKQGSLLLLPPDTVESFSVPSEKDLIMVLQIPLTYVCNKLLSPLQKYSLPSEYLLSLLHHKESISQYLLYDFSADSRIHNLMVDMCCEYMDPSNYSDSILANYIQLLFLQLVQNTVIAAGKKNDQLLLDILQFIESNFQHCSLEQIAKEFNYSQKYVSVLIKRKTGKTYGQIIKSYRLDTAARLLKFSTLPIQEIAESCGYLNQTFFYSEFQKTYHMTPSAYRNQLKNEI